MKRDVYTLMLGDDDEEKRAKRRSLIAVMKCQVYLFANTLFVALTNANKSTFCFTFIYKRPCRHDAKINLSSLFLFPPLVCVYVRMKLENVNC